VRALPLLVLLGGCNVALGLDEVKYEPVDASIDAAVPEHIVAWLPLDTINDKATPDLAAGAATCGECPRQATGKIDGAMEFTETSQAFRLPQRPALETTTAFTVSFWMNLQDPPMAPGVSCAVQKLYGQTEHSWQFCVDSTGMARYTVQDMGVVSVTRLFSLDVWHHVALTWTGVGINLYLDGATPTAGQAASVRFHGGPVTIGEDVPGGSPIFGPKGLIDDVRIYDVALSRAEIEVLAAP